MDGYTGLHTTNSNHSIGKLSEGEYAVKLKVTTILRTEYGDRVVEENVAHKSVRFNIN